MHTEAEALMEIFADAAADRLNASRSAAISRRYSGLFRFGPNQKSINGAQNGGLSFP
jgi:hypothetical protein